MPVEIDGHLIVVALICGSLCLWFLRKELPLPVNAAMVLFRIGLPFYYFTVLFPSSVWHFNDDIGYLMSARYMHYSGNTPFSVLFTSDGMAALLIASRGSHLLYRWWVFFGTWCFGDYYYAPVFLNIVMTVIGATYGRRIMAELGFSKSYQSGYLVFLLVQWDIVAWATIANMKEPLSMYLITATFYYLIRLTKLYSHRDLVGLLVFCFLLFMIRSYMVLLILGALTLWAMAESKNPKKWLLVPLVVFVGANVLQHLGGESVASFRPDQLLIGMLRFPITPQPWQLSDEYTFLLWPSIFHWLLIVPSIFMAFRLWKISSQTRLLLSYLPIMTIFFAAVPEVQGPRHRVQMTFLLAWLQFHVLWKMASARAGNARLPQKRNGSFSTLSSPTPEARA